MLLGRDEIIRDVCPAYRTDALVRKVNINRYDDRLTVVTNLVESFEQLLEFATLHLPDKFHVEGAERKSLRNIVAREMLVNTLMHREYSSSYQAKFVMEQDKMFVENANRARFNGTITLRNLEPFPKNPLIASFFRNIGYSEIPHYPTVEWELLIWRRNRERAQQSKNYTENYTENSDRNEGQPQYNHIRIVKDLRNNCWRCKMAIKKSHQIRAYI